MRKNLSEKSPAGNGKGPSTTVGPRRAVFLPGLMSLIAAGGEDGAMAKGAMAKASPSLGRLLRQRLSVLDRDCLLYSPAAGGLGPNGHIPGDHQLPLLVLVVAQLRLRVFKLQPLLLSRLLGRLSSKR